MLAVEEHRMVVEARHTLAVVQMHRKLLHSYAAAEVQCTVPAVIPNYKGAVVRARRNFAARAHHNFAVEEPHNLVDQPADRMKAVLDLYIHLGVG
jgi:hypothetical protein